MVQQVNVEANPAREGGGEENPLCPAITPGLTAGVRQPPLRYTTKKRAEVGFSDRLTFLWTALCPFP